MYISEELATTACSTEGPAYPVPNTIWDQELPMSLNADFFMLWLLFLST